MIKGGDDMSILDSIKQAEAKAEQRKQDAHDEVEALLAKAKEDATAKAKQMIEDAYHKEEEANKDTLNQIKDKQEAIDNDYAKEDKRLQSVAIKRLDTVCSFVIERVLKS